MTPRRITQNLAAILLFALIAAACGGSSTPQATTTDRDVVASEGATEDADPEQTDDDVISETAGESQEAPLFDPTAVDLPYDVSASAEPNDEDVQILTGNPHISASEFDIGWDVSPADYHQLYVGQISIKQ